MNPKFLSLLASNRGKGEFKSDASTIYLYDAIVDSEIEAELLGGVSPKAFIKELNAMSTPVINLRINSPGGSVFAARAMEQAIREHPSKVIAHIDGCSASAASFMMLAADEIVASPGAMIMVHKAWTMAFGNSDDLLDTADLLEKVDSTLVQTYASRTKQSPEQINEWMAAETWFTADEALSAGLVDKVAEVKVTAKAWDLSAYDKAPRQPAPEPEETAIEQVIEPEQESLPPVDVSALLRRLEVASRI